MDKPEARYSEFYRMLDQAFLKLPSLAMKEFEERLEEIAASFENERNADPWFAHEVQRELASRLLVASVEKDAGVAECIERYKRVRSFLYEDVILEWLNVCQLSRYLGRHSQRNLIMDDLLKLREELELCMEGCEESLRQLDAEIKRGNN